MQKFSMQAVLLLVFMAIEVLRLESKAADFSKYQDADALWRRIQEIDNAPQNRPASQEEAKKAVLDRFDSLDESISAFSKQFPNDPRRWDAKIIQLTIAPTLARLRNAPAPRVEETEWALNEIEGASDASESAKKEASFLLVNLHSSQVRGSAEPSAIKKVDQEIQTFAEKNPIDPRVDSLNLLRAKLNAQVDPKLAEKILTGLTSSSNQRIAAQAKSQLRMIQVMREPLDLDFQTVDGQAVSLKNLRGKVVLVDFWATWCGPCMKEVPNTVATYKDLRDHGFEIVGICLDKDIDRMRLVTEQMGMTWPQYCDGKGWQNEISSRYGIDAIPSTWLVDKRGYVRYVGLRGKVLSDRIQELQAE